METQPAGGEEEFAGFCASHHTKLVGMLGLFCGSRELGEELAQESLMRAYRDWPKVRAMEAPVAWVYRVGTNLARSHFRRRRAEARARARLQAQPDPPTFDPPIVLEVRESIRSLPPRMRSAIVLRYYGGFRISEIAAALECSESLVKKLLHGALDRLRAAEDTIDGRRSIDAT